MQQWVVNLGNDGRLTNAAMELVIKAGLKLPTGAAMGCPIKATMEMLINALVDFLLNATVSRRSMLRWLRATVHR